MSFVIAAPETLVRAASDLANIGSTLGAANAAALGPTTELLAAGADEVSAAIASLFAAHGQAYQAVSAQMSAFHAQFVQTFTAGAPVYASAPRPAYPPTAPATSPDSVDTTRVAAHGRSSQFRTGSTLGSPDQPSDFSAPHRYGIVRAVNRR